ncbi:hypothetical protein [Shewanella surugensis]|uniref:DUF2541 family protein n=1 Tax=Shewanella surugensis TaxID=212020 RepID=A0ABT0LFA7_9GAMM|nr:hypothetical protein [Shewanella surugensis]MCL1126378.1 hypothetical protein [Shewanella surugensis]
MTRIKLITPILVILICSFNTHSQTGRLRVPEYVECPRDQVSSWQGRVITYHRSNSMISLVIDTDANTTEKIKIHYTKLEQLFKQLYLRGQPFKATDWPTIEQSKSIIRDNTLVTVWFCQNKQYLSLINWQSAS